MAWHGSIENNNINEAKIGGSEKINLWRINGNNESEWQRQWRKSNESG